VAAAAGKKKPARNGNRTSIVREGIDAYRDMTGSF